MNLKDYQHAVSAISEEFAATGLSPHQLFQFSILKMNTMYDLPINEQPSLDYLGESPVKRMQGFMKTLQKEMEEGAEILFALEQRDIARDLGSDFVWSVTNLSNQGQVAGLSVGRAHTVAIILVNAWDTGGMVEVDRQILVMLADWLGDMTVYNRSEALKYGIPLESALACIMGSNFTKLGADGLPIKDANGKVQKGPNFVPPEAAIYATMFESDALLQEANDLIMAAEAVQVVAIPVLDNPMAEVFLAVEEADEEYEVEGEDDAAAEDEGDWEI